MKIINIRGTHGAGKSWVVREVMSRLQGPREIVLRPEGKKVEGTLIDGRVFVIGGYKEGVSTGGCDTIKSEDEIQEIVLRHAEAGENVLFEGIRVNGGHSRWIAQARDNRQHEFCVLILNTKVEQCMENIRRRRIAAGLDPMNEDKVGIAVRDHWRRNQRQVTHFRQAGVKVEVLSSNEAVGRVLDLLGIETAVDAQ